VKIHEHQAKEIFSTYGVPVPKGANARSADEARRAFVQSGFRDAMVKAQVLAGGRGKAGGVLRARSADEAAAAAQALIGKTLRTAQSGGRGAVVRSVLVEERRPFERELYLGLAVDRSQGLPVLIFSEAGGMDIEEVAARTPERILRVPFDLSAPAAFGGALRVSPELEPHRARLADLAARLARLFVETDAQLVEVNPLVHGPDGFLALDAKIVFDDNALFRHPEWEALRDPDEDDAKERRAKRSGLSYISMEGNIGCLVNGAGLAMATMDIIQQAGGKPANFLDVGGGATQDQVLEGFRIILDDPHVRAILVNIFGGIMKCDIIAQALVNAAAEIGIPVPVIVRLEGTRVEEGRAILAGARAGGAKLALHTARTMQEAAETAVRLAKEAHVSPRR
jgi:succinyl-CoA synthetase beta subunit